MAQNFIHTLFTDGARALQAKAGSRPAYARMEDGAVGAPDRIDDAARGFIAQRDSFYLASVTDDGWPYVQHRGGPPGFLHVIDDGTLAFPDYPGNRQYISMANFGVNDRVAMILMDYPNRRRLKIIGRVRIVEASEHPDAVAELMLPGQAMSPVRAFIVSVVGLDWNCPQHITPRFTEAEWLVAMANMSGQVPS
jgi:uncharacterized protein